MSARERASAARQCDWALGQPCTRPATQLADWGYMTRRYCREHALRARREARARISPLPREACR
jgi:hypothetical protein